MSITTVSHHVPRMPQAPNGFSGTSSPNSTVANNSTSGSGMGQQGGGGIGPGATGDPGNTGPTSGSGQTPQVEAKPLYFNVSASDLVQLYGGHTLTQPNIRIIYAGDGWANPKNQALQAGINAALTDAASGDIMQAVNRYSVGSPIGNATMAEPQSISSTDARLNGATVVDDLHIQSLLHNNVKNIQPNDVLLVYPDPSLQLRLPNPQNRLWRGTVNGASFHVIPSSHTTGNGLHLDVWDNAYPRNDIDGMTVASLAALADGVTNPDGVHGWMTSSGTGVGAACEHDGTLRVQNLKNAWSTLAPQLYNPIKMSCEVFPEASVPASYSLGRAEHYAFYGTPHAGLLLLAATGFYKRKTIAKAYRSFAPHLLAWCKPSRRNAQPSVLPQVENSLPSGDHHIHIVPNEAGYMMGNMQAPRGGYVYPQPMQPLPARMLPEAPGAAFQVHHTHEFPPLPVGRYELDPDAQVSTTIDYAVR